MEMSGKHLGKILIDKGLITSGQLDDALIEQRRTKEFLGSIFVRRKQIKEKDLLEALSEKFNIPLAGIKDKYINWDFVKKFSATLILEHKCLPIRADDDSITVAIINPLDAWMLKKLEEETLGFKLKLVLVPQGEMTEVLEMGKRYLQ